METALQCLPFGFVVCIATCPFWARNHVFAKMHFHTPRKPGTMYGTLCMHAGPSHRRMRYKTQPSSGHPGQYVLGTRCPGAMHSYLIKVSAQKQVWVAHCTLYTVHCKLHVADATALILIDAFSGDVHPNTQTPIHSHNTPFVIARFLLPQTGKFCNLSKRCPPVIDCHYPGRTMVSLTCIIFKLH